MAFSNAPENQTYSSHRVPLAHDYEMRAGAFMNYPFDDEYAQGAGMINVLPVKGAGDQLEGITRPGALGCSMPLQPTDNARGIYVWEKAIGNTFCFMVVGQNVYTTNISPLLEANWTHVDTLTTVSKQPVRFTEFIDSTNTKKLVLVDGVDGYVYTSNAAGTKIVDADFPTPHIPWPVFLNGRLYLAKTATGDIYCSDLDDPAVWTAGNFISTEVYPDDVQALLKIDNYILAVGIQGSEYFYDAANATGSPLARYEGGILPFGTQIPNSIAVNKNVAVILANTGDGQFSFKVIEGLRHVDLPSAGAISAYVARLSNPYTDGQPLAAEYFEARGNFFRHAGELYYCFMADGERGGDLQAAHIGTTLAFSFKTKTWSELQYGDSTTDRSARWAFPMYCTTNSLTTIPATFCAGNFGATNTACFYKLDDSLGSDVLTINAVVSTTPIYQETRLPNLDFGTLNLKAMHRVGIGVESYQSATNMLIYEQHNDRDGATGEWSTARAFPSVLAADYFPCLTQLGMFRRRFMRFFTANGMVLRWKYAEFDINKGQQ